MREYVKVEATFNVFIDIMQMMTTCFDV